MERNLKLIELYYIYGKLLTLKQRKTFELYYLSDLSLREIAENTKVTFQAVRYSLETSRNALLNFEKIVNMFEYKKQIKELYNLCEKENIENNEIIEKFKKLIE